MKLNLIMKFGSALALVVAVGACSTQDRANQSAAANEAAGAVAEVSGPTDAEILHVLKTANTAEIQAAEMAKKKAKNKKVRQFASHMIKDHSDVNQKITDLANKLNVTPDENEISTSLSTGADATMSSLKDLKGKEFDKAYMDSQVTMHESVLETIDNRLMPNAKAAELKTMLEEQRPKIAKHLEDAKNLQTTVAK